jgi:hypothetical protein
MDATDVDCLALQEQEFEMTQPVVQQQHNSGSVHPAAPGGDVPAATPRSSPLLSAGSELPRGPEERIAELEREVAHVGQWYGSRLEILSAWAREHLNDEQQQTFFNIAANGRPHHTDEPEWFRQWLKEQK